MSNITERKEIKHYTIPVFIPGLACPFQCVFCNQNNISGVNEIPDPKSAVKTITEHLSTMPSEGAHIEIGFFGGNFTGIPFNIQEEYLKAALPYIESGRVKGIRLSTRPDYITSEALRLLKKYGVKTIELGAQSLDKTVLRLSGRGHSVEDIEKASEMILSEGFSLGLQMMTGLPGDTMESSVYTAERIVELGADNTRIYPALVIKDTKMADLYYKGKYRPLTLNEAVERCARLLKIFEQAGVNVIRLGLHPSEGLSSGDSLIAGPFHVSFRELVLSFIWKELLTPLTENSHNQAGTLQLKVAPGQINYAAGYKGENRDMLLQCFRKVSFREDPELKGREFNADCC